ncbi:MAG: DUF3488 and transglutaminase-like domain-containing protein [Gammaproteobacteria bacterium]|nr:DUF3488 and transglutaminase-like domain-containing protein [Gammaproteobacteria bacterium]
MNPLQAEVAGWRLTQARMLWLCAAMVLVLAPHALRIPFWISGLFLLFAGWRLHALREGKPLPRRWVLIGVLLMMLSGVYLSYHTLTGLNAGAAMLAALAGLKILESRTLRDAYVVVFLGYFLVVTNFLFSQSIPTGLYMLVVVAVLTGTLMAITSEEPGFTPQRQLRLSTTMLAQAVPVMLVAFVLFPRIPGPLWGLPKDAFSARSGLSDTMQPGSISQVSLSDEVAFRVRFQGDIPPGRDLYWRGPVLWNTDGETWTRGGFRFSHEEELPGSKAGAVPVDYTVTLEPHNRRWLFALDVPAAPPEGKYMSTDFMLRSPKRIRERYRYPMRSYLGFRMTRTSWDDFQRGLALPPGQHEKARALALEWRQELDDGRAIVNRALAYFRQQPFYYTLTPPVLSGDKVDEFLFGTRRGFCELYASAFTVLMRAAGIPARVVTGYQGGEVNELGNFLTVRQRDAHAWAEVWLDESGWTRVDPTAAVAPERIQQGMDAAIPSPIGPRVLNIQPSEPVRRALTTLRQTWDALNSAWNEWVLGYGPERQRLFLDRVGVDSRDLVRLALALLTIVGVLLVAVALWLARRPGDRDPVVRAYRRYQRKLGRAGLRRQPGEGPVDYARRVIAARPDLAGPVKRITDLYVALRYADAEEDPRTLRREVSALKA